MCRYGRMGETGALTRDRVIWVGSSDQRASGSRCPLRSTTVKEIGITKDLAAALHALVDASDAAERAPTDRQAARRAIEQALVVVRLARSDGFGGGTQR